MMPDDHRLHYVVMLFYPPAAEQIFSYRANNSYVTWKEFLDDVSHQFHPQCFENYIRLIAKLMQTGSVADYHATFEKYLNRVKGVPESTLIPIFVVDLQNPVRQQLRLHRPATLASAMALTLELAATHAEKPAQQTFPARRPRVQRDSRHKFGSMSAPPVRAAPVAKGNPNGQKSGDNSRLPVVRVSNADKAEHSCQGIYWYCDEKWASGRTCKRTFLAYLGEDNEEGEEVEQYASNPDEDIITADISHLHSMESGKRTKALRVMGSIEDVEVNILIDTSSSHDFLHPRIAERLHLSLSLIRPFKVYVGNDTSLLCTHISQKTKLVNDKRGFAHVSLN